MASWALQDAELHLEEVLEKAEQDGPQFITAGGVETAVIVSIEEWRRKQAQSPKTMFDILSAFP